MSIVDDLASRIREICVEGHKELGVVAIGVPVLCVTLNGKFPRRRGQIVGRWVVFRTLSDIGRVLRKSMGFPT